MNINELNTSFVKTLPIYASITATTSNLSYLDKVLTISKGMLENQFIKLGLKASCYVNGIYEETMIYISFKTGDATYNSVVTQEKECTVFQFYYEFNENDFILYIKQNLQYASTKIFLIDGSLSNVTVNLNSLFNISLADKIKATISSKNNVLGKLSNNWVADDNEDNYITRSGDLVSINLLLSGGELITDETTQLILTLPVNYRPSGMISIYPHYKGSDTNEYITTRGRIYSSGELKVFSLTNNTQLHITATFRV